MRRDDRAVGWQHAAVPRVGESRPDWEIWIDLAHAIARLDTKNPQAYWTNAFPPEWKDDCKLWTTFVEHTSSMKGMTAERLEKRTGPLHWRCPDETHPGVTTLYLNHPTYAAAVDSLGHKGKRFLTPSGKIEITTAELDKKLRAAGDAALPSFYTHPEVTGKHPTKDLVRNPVKIGAVSPLAKPAMSDGKVHVDYPLMGIIGRSSVVQFAGITQWAYSGKQLDGVRLIQVHPKVTPRTDPRATAGTTPSHYSPLAVVGRHADPGQTQHRARKRTR